jgi:hypothetical protein
MVLASSKGNSTKCSAFLNALTGTPSRACFEHDCVEKGSQ